MLLKCSVEKTLESLLDCKEIQPVNLKGSKSWIFIGRTDAEAETPILWPPDMKNWLILKDRDAGKDWRWEEKGKTEDEMVGWYHQHNGHESEWTPVVDDGQRGLACCSSWGCKESDMTEQLNWTNRASPTLAAKNVINLISVLTIWWCPCVEASLLLLEEGVCNDQCILLAKLCWPLTYFILYSKAKFACYSRYFLISYFCIPVPYNEKDMLSFLGGSNVKESA